MIPNQSMNQNGNNILAMNQNMMNEFYQKMLKSNFEPNTMNMMLQMSQNLMLMNFNQNQMKGYIQNEDYYKIIHQNPLSEKNLNKSQKNLSLFFNGITDFKKNIPKYGNKILINYYNLEKIELYLDLDLNIEKLISIIFGSIFFYSHTIKIYKRTKNDQTTEWITMNPFEYYNISDIFSPKTFFLEYKNKNLFDLSNKTGKEIGLKDGEEILLKLNKNFKDELVSLPLDGTYLPIKLDSFNLLFPTFDEESTEQVKKRL